MEFKREPFVHNVPDQDLIDDAKNTAKKLGKDYITADEYDEYGKYSAKNLWLRFHGWGNLLILAGLKNVNEHNISDEDLLENLQDVWLELGKQPRIAQMTRPLSKYSGRTYTKRFGNWNIALDKVYEHAKSSTEPESQDEEIQIKGSDLPEPFHHVTKREPSNRLKFMIMAAKGNKCAVCGITLIGTSTMHFDHIKPWSKGGETTFENIQILCAPHNLAKGDLDLSST